MVLFSPPPFAMAIPQQIQVKHSAIPPFFPPSLSSPPCPKTSPAQACTIPPPQSSFEFTVRAFGFVGQEYLPKDSSSLCLAPEMIPPCFSGFPGFSGRALRPNGYAVEPHFFPETPGP